MSKIYLSATYKDLKGHREAVYRTLRKMRHDVIAMEDYVAADQRPVDKCLADVAECDLYIGIFAWRYGYIPATDNPEQLSITALEYRKARELGKPRLIFLVDRRAKWPDAAKDTITGEGDRGARVSALRKELEAERQVSFFRTRGDLATGVSLAVHDWERKIKEHSKQTALGRLVDVPELPPHFLLRLAELESLKSLLVEAATTPVVVTGVTQRIGIQGMGGIGKSVLATALARDESVRMLFPDGILWVTLGQEPALTSRQAQLAEALGDGPRVFDDVQRGKSRLSTLLADKACLLVLDDVWQAWHSDAFDVLGTSSRMLVTTRDAGLVEILGATNYSVDLLTDEQALTLLAEWAAQPLAKLPKAATQVAQECGNLPLALAMIGAMVRGKQNRWANVLRRLRNADLERIGKQFPNYPYPNLMRALQVSVEALDQNVQTRYLDFAVFPEDTSVPEVVLQILWEQDGIDQYEADDVIDILVDRSLARRDERGYLKLHDLQYDYVRKQISDLTALHNRLTTAYAARCPNGWPSGPNDDYFYDHLSYHLHKGCREQELRRLLLWFDWLAVRLEATNINGLLMDYQYLPEDANVRLVRGALELSAHILAEDKAQLAGQVIGRLMFYKTREIQELLDDASKRSAGPWLRPLVPSLTRPGGAQLRTLMGHNDFVAAIAMAADGRLAISASNDCTLKVWDLTTGLELYTIWDHTDPVRAVAVTADGTRAVSSSDDGTVKLWDVASETRLFTWMDQGSPTGAVAITADGRRVVSGSDDGTIRLWDVTSRNAVLTLKGHEERVTAVAMAADGRLAISASNDCTLKVWDLTTGLELYTLKGHNDPIRSVAMAADGRLAISASNDCTLKVWDLTTGLELYTLKGHNDWVTAVALTADGRRAISGSVDRTLRVWDLASGTEVRILKGHINAITSVAITADGQKAISAVYDPILKLWDLEAEVELRTPAAHDGWITAVSITADGRLAISASNDCTLKVWDARNGTESTSSLAHESELAAVALAEDGRTVIAGTWDNTLLVFDVVGNTRRAVLRGHNDWVTAVALTADGRRAISGSVDRTLRVWDLDSGTEVRILKGHDGWVNSVAISADGQKAISGSDDKTVKVWDVDAGSELYTLSGHSDWVRGVAMTEDGRLGVSAASDHTLKVWDLKSGTESRTLIGHADRVTGVALTGDGLRAISTSDDKTLKVWDLTSGNVLATFRAEDWLLNCAVARDGSIIITGDQSGHLHFLLFQGDGQSDRRIQ